MKFIFFRVKLLHLKSTFGEFNQKMSHALSKCLIKWTNWIISKSNHNIWKNLDVLNSYHEYLERTDSKIRAGIFFMLKYSKIAVCFAISNAHPMLWRISNHLFFSFIWLSVSVFFAYLFFCVFHKKNPDW